MKPMQSERTPARSVRSVLAGFVLVPFAVIVGLAVTGVLFLIIAGTGAPVRDALWHASPGARKQFWRSQGCTDAELD